MRSSEIICGSTSLDAGVCGFSDAGTQKLRWLRALGTWAVPGALAAAVGWLAAPWYVRTRVLPELWAQYGLTMVVERQAAAIRDGSGDFHGVRLFDGDEQILGIIDALVRGDPSGAGGAAAEGLGGGLQALGSGALDAVEGIGRALGLVAPEKARHPRAIHARQRARLLAARRDAAQAWSRAGPGRRL